MFDQDLDSRPRRRGRGSESEEPVESVPGKSNVLTRQRTGTRKRSSSNVQVHDRKARRGGLGAGNGGLVGVGHDLVSNVKRLFEGLLVAGNGVKGFLWICFFLLGVAGVVLPLIYLYTASQLPEMRSPSELSKAVGLVVETARRAETVGLHDPVLKARLNRKYEDPNRTGAKGLPRNFLLLYLRQWECPDYLQRPKEEGWPWVRRAFGGLVFADQNDGPGYCELIFARRISSVHLDIEGTLATAIMAHRLHSFLDKPQLLAYDLSALRFHKAPGVVGVEAATYDLFKKELDQLSLAETAELMLALPPWNNYQEIKQCKGPAVIRGQRDNILSSLQGSEVSGALRS
jgi:hypothetical protein